MNYEYKVVPAPPKGIKAKGVKTAEGRFAASVEAVLNQMGAEGWEFLRAELLPSEERSGLTGSVTQWRNLLVFRRPRQDDAAAFHPRVIEPIAQPEMTAVPAPSVRPPEPGVTPRLATGAERMLKDNGVEELSDVAGMTHALRLRAGQSAARDRDGSEAAASGDGADADKDETGKS